MTQTFKYDGFEFEATATYEGPEPGNFMHAGYNVEIEDLRITDFALILEAYGWEETVKILADTEDWIIENASDDIIKACNER